MRTLINDKKLGLLDFVSQQYEVGLYVAVYKDKQCIDQICINKKEDVFHNELRRLDGYVKEEVS